MSIITPRIRLDLEGMSYHIVHALSLSNSELEQQVSDILKEVITSYDLNKEVREIAERELREHLKKSVVSAVAAIFYKREVIEAIEKAVLNALHLEDLDAQKN